MPTEMDLYLYQRLEPVKCGSASLDERVVEAIEEAVQRTKAMSQKEKTVKVRVRPHVLYRPSEYLGSVPPDSDAIFELFERVINLVGKVIAVQEAFSNNCS